MDSFSQLETLVLSEVFPINRAADWLLVMEGIYGSETETDEERPPEESKANERDLPSMRLYLSRHTRTLPPLPEGNPRSCVPKKQD